MENATAPSYHAKLINYKTSKLELVCIFVYGELRIQSA